MPAEPTPHRIRLRGPWEVRPHAADVPPGRMTMPGTLRDGGWTGFTGRVSFYRRFGRPSNLAPSERVWLVFERIVGPAEVRLNDELLGGVDGYVEFDVTEQLDSRNSLEVTVDAAHDECGITGEVCLEIRSTRPADPTPQSSPTNG